MTSSKAPTGRQTTAQGKEPRTAALGSSPQQIPSPEGDGQLPVGWTNAVIEDCLLAYENGRKIRQGWSPQCEGHPTESRDDWGVLKTSAIQDGLYVDTANKQLPEKLEPRAHLEVEVGDILITCAGPRSRCGVACLVRKTRSKLLISGKMYQLRADPEIIDRGLLELFLREPRTQKCIDEMKTGISDSGLNLTHSRFATLSIPLPPLAEQRRIVAKIEELFSELDAGEESLRRARRQLGVYRQSLLKQAFEGKLTEQWRKQNPQLLESPDQLLKRIQSTRTAKSLHPSKSTPETIDRTRVKLPAIPSEWHWLRLEHVAIIGTGMSVSQARTYDNALEVPYLRVANVQRGRLDLTEMRTMLVERSRLDDLRVKTGDILFNEGGDRDKLGRGWVWSGQIDPCITQNHVFRATAISTSITVPEFISHWGNAYGQDFFHLTGKQTTNLASISKGTLSSLPVPVPPVEEQKEILRLLDEQFTVIEQNEREIDAALKRSTALRQSILKKAFTGQLVPQDPADEPASVLLDRIRNEREELTATQSEKKAAPKRTARHG